MITRLFKDLKPQEIIETYELLSNIEHFKKYFRCYSFNHPLLSIFIVGEGQQTKTATNMTKKYTQISKVADMDFKLILTFENGRH